MHREEREEAALVHLARVDHVERLDREHALHELLVRLYDDGQPQAVQVPASRTPTPWKTLKGVWWRVEVAASRDPCLQHAECVYVQTCEGSYF